MSIIQEYQHLIQLLLTHEPQRSDYTLGESVQREFREMRSRLQVVLERLEPDSSIVTATQPPTEISLDQPGNLRSLCVWLIQNISISIAPHKRLPTEIWSEIFMKLTPGGLFFPPDHTDLILLLAFMTPTVIITPWTLMQVCSRWSQIAKATPELWRNVTIYHNPLQRIPRNRCADRIRRIADVSGGVLSRGTQSLTVSIIVDSSERYSIETESLQSLFGDANPVRDIISPVSRQLLSLHIISSSGLLWRFLESKSLPFESLESLMLELNPVSRPFDTSGFTNVTVFSNAPKLRRIFLFKNDDPDLTFKPGALSHLHEFQLPWEQLTVIELGDAWITPAACYAILAQCPNLSDSELWVSFTEPKIPFNIASHLTIHNSLIHHGLRSISFRFDFPATGSYFPDGFLRPLAFPSLKSLTIKTELRPHHTIEHSILSLIHRSECKLESFSFSKEKDEDEDDFIVHLDLYRVLVSLPPTLHSLILYSWPITRNMLDLMVRGLLFPKLEYFTCCLESWEGLSLFLDFVEARNHAPDIHPIVEDACAMFSPPPQMNEFSKQVKERAKSVMKIAKEDGRRVEVIGLLDYWDYMQGHAPH